MEKNAYVAQALTKEQKESFEKANEVRERRSGLESGNYDICPESVGTIGTGNDAVQTLLVGAVKRENPDVVFPATIGFDSFCNAHGLTKQTLMEAAEKRTFFGTKVTKIVPTELEKAQAMAKGTEARIRRRYEAIK